ncbi:hypothetical protein EJ04DRAFT_62911 [Polyplosphaeria fusca]|uniref:Uncharacterized protein n=1 Tax=Polyplosphaeria fusca TaxID=682080 RepID=A0A9P4QRZ5_9PLEO|nr:hypothetical protein EJ04DRAFT_62911 [Polyplosphaeria fusca]
MHVSDTPSSLSKQPTLIQGIDLPDVPDEDWKCHAVRRSIVNSGEPLANLKSSNVFLRCVASLLEWQMSCAPQYALIYPQFHGELPMKYWHQSPFIGFHDVRERWLDLRRETDSRRTTLLSLPIFLAVNFRRPGDQLIEACARLVDAYEAYVKGLGIEEAALKDYIEVQSSGSSTEMARISIQESKRVILLTFLAFVFLPISLASSIYGMNVQQINQTGHHIGVFVATAFLLLLTTFGLWLVSAAFVAVRASLSDKYEEKQRNNPVQRLTLRDKIFLVGQSLRWPF